MNDGRIPRKCQVVLLDERKLDFLVQPRLLSSELLDMVSSHFNLHEKEYFGLFHTDDAGNTSWLSLDRKVLDHDLPRYADPVILYFAVRFYVPRITYFREKVTVELFYLQAKSLIFKGNIHCESDIVFELGAYVLQAAFGDFVSEDAARSDIKKVPILPTRTLKEHPSITYCEDMVIGHYQKLIKMKKGQAIVEYLNTFRSIPTYGVHYYEVKDKGNIPWWIGFSSKGVGVYDHADKTKPRKVYKWQQIINVDFKERKFSVEVKDLRKISEVSLDGSRNRSNSLSRRNNGIDRGPIHPWYANTTMQAKAMWTMAISQHQFYLDKRDQEDKLTTPRTLEEIANELSRSGSLNSSLASVVSDSSEPSEGSGASSNGGESSLSTEIAQKEMITALAARKEALQQRLEEKIEELKRICFKEAEITGEYPPETPYNPNCPPPPVKIRVGTKFTYSDFVLKNDPVEREEKLQKLERELEIQSKITEAAEKLASDSKASKNVKKSRKLTYQKSFSKLKSLEQAIKRLKESQSEDIDGGSLNSYEDEVDATPAASLSRRDSFKAATRRRKTSNSSSLESLQSVSRVQAGISSNDTRHNGDLSSTHLDALNSTPEFASSNQINEMLYRNKPHYTSGLGRKDSNTSIVSMSSSASERGRVAPPSYSESHFSKRESSVRPQFVDERRGSAPRLYSHDGDQLQDRYPEEKFENHAGHNNTSASTKVRYVGGLNSPTTIDSDYNSNVTTRNSDDDGTSYWLKTSARNRSNIAAARFNYPSKLGIMSDSESTGSYHLNYRFFSRSNYQDDGVCSDQQHLSSSSSAIDVSTAIPHSHHSNYSLADSHLPGEPRIRQFIHDDRGEWSDEDESSISLV